MNSDKQKTLEDLVPPLELCKAAREVIGDRTALVWLSYQFCEGGNTYHKVLLRDDHELMSRDSVEYSRYPAPTLAELLEMLPETHYSSDFEYVGFMSLTRLHPSLSDPFYHICYTHTELVNNRRCRAGDSEGDCDANPATAALRLLMKVKGV